jgi:hypothetical protein
MKTLILQMLFIVVLIAMAVIAWAWMQSDISGEYASNDARFGTITMSVFRKATTVRAELAYGNGSLLEATAPYNKSGQTLDWTFSVAQKWIDRGQRQRYVLFHGTIENGTVKGVLKDGPVESRIKLPRNGIASIYRMLQSHLPWVG